MATQTHNIRHPTLRRNESNEYPHTKLDEHPSNICKNSSSKFDGESRTHQYSKEILEFQTSSSSLSEATIYKQTIIGVGKPLESKEKRLKVGKTSTSLGNHRDKSNNHKDKSEDFSECLSHNTSYDELSFLDNFDEIRDEQSPESPEESPIETVKKNEKFKKPIMEPADEELLLELGPKYKNDWKKISKRIFNLRNRRFNPKFLMARYKELVTDSSVKRVRFTHEEDLLIAKYFTKYGNDWGKIAIHFNNRTPTMLKNRYYSHIRKRNLLDELLSEADDDEEKQLPEEIEAEPLYESEPEDVQTNIYEDDDKCGSDQEILHFFTQKNHKVKCKKIKIPLARLMFEINEFVAEEELCDKVTPLLN